MTPSTVAKAIVAIVQDKLPEIKVALDPPPDDISSERLPACYVLTSGATDQVDNDDFDLEVRVYRLQFPCVARTDASAMVRETRIRPILVKAKQIFRGYQNLNIKFIRNSRIIGDSGIVVLPEYGNRFVGFELRLEVTEIIPAPSYDK